MNSPNQNSFIQQKQDTSTIISLRVFRITMPIFGKIFFTITTKRFPKCLKYNKTQLINTSHTITYETPPLKFPPGKPVHKYIC